MLSVLIPTFNYTIFPLVTELHQQCLSCGIDFEILVIDDCSNEYRTENEKINTLTNSSFQILDKNIGRSSIRNFLAKKAKFENLLFLDADTMPINSALISTYINEISDEEKVIYGGIKYQEKKPNKTQLLRWIYGNHRESLTVNKRNSNPYLAFLSLNFLIKKSLFTKVQFNETIPNLRHEDTLFSYDLQRNKIQISHIENPVIHLGLENSQVFLKKSEEALIGLKHLIETELIDPKYVKISRYYLKIKQNHLQQLCLFLYKITKPLLTKNLFSNSPSLFVFDCYRLGYFCELNSK